MLLDPSSLPRVTVVGDSTIVSSKTTSFPSQMILISQVSGVFCSISVISLPFLDLNLLIDRISSKSLHFSLLGQLGYVLPNKSRFPLTYLRLDLVVPSTIRLMFRTGMRSRIAFEAMSLSISIVSTLTYFIIIRHSH